jgi:phosphoesterase RecJ-like protein
MTISSSQAAEFLAAHDQYLILTHVRPDGDTVGCAASLCRALRSLGKAAHVLPNPEITPLFSPYLKGLLAPEEFLPDTVVSVDIAARSLFPDNALTYLPRVDLAIDHHPSQEFFARETCLDAGRAACGELMYDILRQLGPVTADIALPLYVAVSTDCGCFVYGNTSADTHRVAAALMDTGIPTAELNKRHFRTKSFRRLRLESLLTESMEFHDDGEIAIATISLEMLAQLQATEADAEDIAAFVGQVEGVKTGITIRELKPGCCKISLRTDPSQLNASAVCALLGGGGHAAASGATVDGDIQQTKEVLMTAIRQVQGLQA